MKILNKISGAVFLISFAAMGLAVGAFLVDLIIHIFQSDIAWYFKLGVAAFLTFMATGAYGDATSDKPTIDFDSKTDKFNINKYEQR